MNKRVVIPTILTLIASIIYPILVNDTLFITLTFVMVCLWIYTTLRVLTEVMLFNIISNVCTIKEFTITMLLCTRFDSYMINILFIAFSIMRIIFTSNIVSNIIYFTFIIIYIRNLVIEIRNSMEVYNTLINEENK